LASVFQFFFHFRVTEIVSSKFFDITKRNKTLFWLTGGLAKEEKVIKLLHDFTDNVIRKRRAELLNKKQGCDEVDEDDDIGSKKKLALLDVLLQSTIDGKPLTNLDIREEVDTFVFEGSFEAWEKNCMTYLTILGHDTTTSGIAFCLYQLAKNPEAQQKAFDEIRQVIGDDVTKPVTHKDLSDLNYLDLCIKETLRIFPSVPFYGRKIQEDVEIGKN
jgi:cytochrome P450 family 4